MSLTLSELGIVQRLLLRDAAITLTDDQTYLVESRLTGLARETGFASVPALVSTLERDRSLHQRVIDALTINETTFFRDRHPFEALKNHILPQVLLNRAQERRVTFWSAACSSGQEAYSLAMLIREFFPAMRSWNIRIVGTDISVAMVNKARQGLYSQLEVGRGLPGVFLNKYFERQKDGFRVRDDVRSMVEFRPANLDKPDSSLRGFDVIFLRNVLIYFSHDVRCRVLTRAAEALRPEGFLFLGTTESPIGCEGLEPTIIGRTTVYRGRRHDRCVPSHR